MAHCLVMHNGVEEYMKDTTLVRFHGDSYREIPTASIKFVGGPDGVFATYQDGNQIHFLGGDDGAWWEITCYHIDWCDGIAQNIYSYCTKGRRK